MELTTVDERAERMGASSDTSTAVSLVDKKAATMVKRRAASMAIPTDHLTVS